MAAIPKAWYVSQLMTQDARDMDEQFKNCLHSKEFDDLVEAVGKALRDVEFHRTSPNVAVVYRKGDLFALGEIGYKNTKFNGRGELTYFVQSRRIRNEKYRDNSWQHFIISTKVLKTAVSAASTYLVPFDCKESVEATKDVVRRLISDSTSKFHSRAREAFRTFTGDVGFSSNMDSELMRELRTHTFISPALNEAAAAYYAAYDAWKDAEAATNGGTYYVGITDNYGQQVVDTARVDMSFPYYAECFDRMPAESVADWVKGRVAVLSMTQPLHYVRGVGIKLDDRMFYVVGEKEGE